MTKRVLPETAKKSTEQRQLPTKPAKAIILSEEKQVLKLVNKYESTTKFTGWNTKLFAKNWKKLDIVDIATNGLRLGFKEFPRKRQCQFRTLKNDEVNIVEA